MKKNEIKKVLMIGSGPIVIGQAAEFDYSGSQCLQVLKELGINSVLVNSNPATIMTDRDMADVIYMEPLTIDFLQKIILKERPDGILSSFGGQTALNLTKELAESGFLEKNKVKVLGCGLRTIKLAEDRFLFRNKMIELGIPVPEGQIVTTMDKGLEVASSYGYPVIVRPAYTLGGAGGGLAHSEEEFRQILERGLHMSSIGQCLVEKSIAGFKEVEYEVMCDHSGNAIVVCNMENLDPVGVHTGDSIVVAPSQTLTDREYQDLRDVSLRIVRELGITGGCNVQLAQSATGPEFYVIEVNPRVSRSSALASKATGYPIAKIATRIALGDNLDQIHNPITGNTFAAFEPSIDYIVTKIPRWPFDKFPEADRKLGTSMKATGEVMALGRSFEESLQKAIRSLEIEEQSLLDSPFDNLSLDELEPLLQRPTDERIFQLASFFRNDGTSRRAHEITKIDSFFLDRIERLVKIEKEVDTKAIETEESLYSLKRLGFSNRDLSKLSGISQGEIEKKLESFKIKPVVKLVDSCAGEFPAKTPYYYLTYEQFDEREETDRERIVIIGSGPIRIGQGIEFDYSCVHALLACRDAGYESVMINNNPETCSTDFSLSDRLYFEPLAPEDVLNILAIEKPSGVIVQFGGQTALNLSKVIAQAGYNLVGTSLESIEMAEDRDQFENLLEKINVKRPKGIALKNLSEVSKVEKDLEFPVMVRPSFVLGGRAMEIIYSMEELSEYLNERVKVSPDHPVLVDQYIKGKEIEVDAVCDGEDIFIPGIMEHIERAGVHSGDSMAVYPSINLYEDVLNTVVEQTRTLGKALNIRGIFNIQFMYKKGEIFVIEVNPRGSRTVPFISKMTGFPLAKIATEIGFGKKLKDMQLPLPIAPTPDFYSVKVPVFSFDKLFDVEPALGPEMKSTGEALGKDKRFPFALYKGLLSQGVKLPDIGTILVTLSDRYKEEALPMIKGFKDLGFKIISTDGTANYIHEHLGFEVERVAKIGEEGLTLLDLVKNSEVDIIINTLARGRKSNTDGFHLRRTAFEKHIPCFTSIDTAEALLKIYQHTHMGVEAI